MITFYKGEDFTLTFTSTQDISGYTKSVSYFTPFGTPILAVVTPINNFSFSAKFAAVDTATLKAGALNVVVTFTDANSNKSISKAMPAQILDSLVNGNIRTADIPSTSLEIVFEQNTIALDINFVGLTNTQTTAVNNLPADTNGAIATLQNNINTEAATRKSADDTLTANLTTLTNNAEVKTNKTSDIYTNRQSTTIYPNVKGIADYIDNFTIKPWVLSFRKNGDGTGISTINITSNIDTTVTITNGYLYTDSLGNGQTTFINLTHNVATNVHFKVIKNNGFISTNNIIRIDSFTDRANSPIPYFSPANLPAGLTVLSWNGNNTGTGDIANLPAGLTYFVWQGNNTGMGDIANLPAGVTFFYWQGNNTGMGDIANLPAGLTYFYWAGNNTGTGDIANLPAGVTIFIWQGNNTGTFSGTRTWAQNMRKIYLRPAAGVFTSAMTDALLISLATQSSWTSEKTIDLRGNCGARTSASNSAVATLQSYGVTVLTN